MEHEFRYYHKLWEEYIFVLVIMDDRYLARAAQIKKKEGIDSRTWKCGLYLYTINIWQALCEHVRRQLFGVYENPNLCNSYF